MLTIPELAVDETFAHVNAGLASKASFSHAGPGHYGKAT